MIDKNSLASSVLGRQKNIFDNDMQLVQSQFEEVISSARILIIGAAGSIGREVVFELSRFNPAALHCVDISENGLVSVTRKLRSTNTTYRGDYDTFVIDATSHLLEGFMKSQKRYDLVFNLAAIKHVRSEKKMVFQVAECSQQMF